MNRQGSAGGPSATLAAERSALQRVTANRRCPGSVDAVGVPKQSVRRGIFCRIPPLHAAEHHDHAADGGRIRVRANV